MYGEETNFEKSMRDFEAIERDENKNVDEQEIKEQATTFVCSKCGEEFDVYGEEDAICPGCGHLEEEVSEPRPVPRKSKSTVNEQFITCPECGNEVEVSMDGTARCRECGWEREPEEFDESKTNEQETKKVIISFPDMEVDEEALDELGGIEPKDTFTTYFEDGKYSVSHPEADEDFEGISVEDVAKQLKDFLASDQTIKSVGDFEIRESKTVDTVSNDPSFERTVEEFAQVEKDENKNVDESIVQVIAGAVSEEQLSELVSELDVSREDVLQAIADTYENDLALGGDMGTLDEWLSDNLNVETLRDVFIDPEVEEPIESKEEVKEKDISGEKEWFIYIPDEGDWPIKYSGDSKEEAKVVYLKWADRESLPSGSKIWYRDVAKEPKKK